MKTIDRCIRCSTYLNRHVIDGVDGADSATAASAAAAAAADDDDDDSDNFMDESSACVTEGGW